MCFRPGQAKIEIECPNCHKKYPVVGGVKQKKCPMCGEDLTNVEPAGAAPTPGAAPAAGAPKAPGAPVTPTPPRAPAAPAAPKAPGAPQE